MLRNLDCPNCSKNTQLDYENDFGFCQYCGTKIIIKNKESKVHITNLTNKENLLVLIKRAPSDRGLPSSLKEGYNFSKKFLELDPNNFEVQLYQAIYSGTIQEAFDIILRVFNDLKNNPNLFDKKLLEILKINSIFIELTTSVWIGKDKVSLLINSFRNLISEEEWNNFIYDVWLKNKDHKNLDGFEIQIKAYISKNNPALIKRNSKDEAYMIFFGICGIIFILILLVGQ